MRGSACSAAILALLASGLAACAAAPERGSAVPARPVEVRRALPEGTVVRLLPVEVVPPSPDAGAFLDALVREALRQSPFLDIAAGVEDTPAAFALGVHLDTSAHTLTSTLLEDGKPALPLAAAQYPADRLTEAVDALALATRGALGEDASRAPPPVPSARAYSQSRRCVLLTEKAITEGARGNLLACEKLIQRAREQDPGCTMTLAAIADLQLRQGKFADAARTADEGLRYDGRLSPTTQHRLARALEMARGAVAPVLQAHRHDEVLLQLAQVTLRERPYDPHVLCTQALAESYLGDFEHAAPRWRALLARWPSSAFVAYHLAFAELATGHGDAALAAIDKAALHMPRASIVVPRTLALHATGRHKELDDWLAELDDDPMVRSGDTLHHLRRMQAAHALLTGQEAAAVGFLLEDLEWARQRPSRLEALSLDLAADGEVLVALQHGKELETRLAAFEQLEDLPGLFRSVLTYLGGLLHVARTGEHALAAEAGLAQLHHDLWSTSLKAAAYRRRGELLDESRELAGAARLTDDALVRASFARVLRVAGREQDSRDLLAALRHDLLVIDLRHLELQPLLDPARALALLATEPR